jgi:N-ethylmaleimide reductase
MEVVETVIEVWRPDRVGVRLSPLSTFNDVSDDDPESTFDHIAERLSDYRLAYLISSTRPPRRSSRGSSPIRAPCAWST